MGTFTARKKAAKKARREKKLKKVQQNPIPPSETTQFVTLPNFTENEIDMEVLQIEKEQRPSNAKEYSLTGRRIVDIGFIIEQISALANHGKMDCQWKYMTLQQETRRGGLSSSLHFKCKMCGLDTILETNRDTQETDDRLILGCLVAGIGYAQFEDICGALDMPVISRKKYTAAQKRVTKDVSVVASNSMKKAGEEEAALCKELNSVDQDGTPLLTVVADGAWSKRSYKTKYNSKSGVASIVGANTKKILFLGVKNTYCTTCVLAKRFKRELKPHKCYMNWTGTSTSMESSIIVEGFMKSMAMHGVIYDCLIADGDSSTMKKLQIAQPYGPNRQIKKIECKNHLLRSYSYKLKDLANRRISSSNNMVPARLRNQLKLKVMPLRSAMSSAIAFRKQEDGPTLEKLEKLREDLLNGPSHVFGEHAKCIERGYFCHHEPVQGGIVAEMRQCGLFDDIMAILNRLLKHLNSLYLALTNNPCEQYNSILNKFLGGKRVNFTQAGGYELRCFAAAIHYNAKGRTIYHELELDGEYTKKYIEFRSKHRSFPKKPNERKNLRVGPDSDYGLVTNEDEEIINNEPLM